MLNCLFNYLAIVLYWLHVFMDSSGRGSLDHLHYKTYDLKYDFLQ